MATAADPTRIGHLVQHRGRGAQVSGRTWRSTSSRWCARASIREDGTRTRPLFMIYGFENLDHQESRSSFPIGQTGRLPPCAGEPLISPTENAFALGPHPAAKSAAGGPDKLSAALSKCIPPSRSRWIVRPPSSTTRWRACHRTNTSVSLITRTLSQLRTFLSVDPLCPVFYQGACRVLGGVALAVAPPHPRAW